MATAKELEEQLHRAQQDIETLAMMAGSTAREATSDAMNSAANQIEGLSAEAQQVYARALTEGQKARQSAEDHIKANPIAATGIAFLAGLIVAAFFNRR
ncbi:MAG: hypothetical protein AAF744_06790 [Pseudomonadota bacterium]